MNKVNKSRFHDDALLFTTFQYYTIPALYLLAIWLIQTFENPWIAVWVVYTLIPLLDEMFSIDVRNPTKAEAKILEGEVKYKIPLYVCVLSDWLLIYWMLNFLTTRDLNIFDTLGTIFICGNLAASNINIAHELFHKDDILDKTLGTLTLGRNLYMHFAIEHLHGHHKHVGTPIDPASSKQGQTVMEFLPQTLIGSFKSAWNYEANMMKKKHGKVYTYQNRMLWYCFSYILIPYFIYLWFGIEGTCYFLISAANSIIYLETINYVEHYGLSRKEISPGVYEPVDIRHSWNAPHRLSNYLLFKLQRHSDHHENPYKPYQTLCSYEESPCLPHGYTVCILLAWFPKLWFDIMDQQLVSWKTNHKSIQIKNLKDSMFHQKIVNFIFKVGIVTTTLAAISLIS